MAARYIARGASSEDYKDLIPSYHFIQRDEVDEIFMRRFFLRRER